MFFLAFLWENQAYAEQGFATAFLIAVSKIDELALLFLLKYCIDS